MSKTLKKIGKTLNSVAGTPIYKKKLDMSFVILKEWFKSTVSEPVKLVSKNPFNKPG
ncbi:unnamed protein product [marine sediment metagenome]|uniref:Uncharacterized protein n=1 Tax=marine sediment metagenome TaxID=412755 RepID=X1S2J5_9ZZZZ